MNRKLITSLQILYTSRTNIIQSNVYIDESSQNGHRYLGIAGIIIDISCLERFRKIIYDARSPELTDGELKWTKVSKTMLPAYKRVVSSFFNNTSEVSPAEFHSVIIDCSKLNDKKYNSGSREIGFNKEIYQTCMKFCRIYNDRVFNIYLDERTTKSRTEDLRTILNRGAASHLDRSDHPFRRLHFRKSHETPELQIVDILLGAIMFKLNGHYNKSNASPSKKELSDYIMELADIEDVFRDTSVRGKFTIWHRQLKK